MQPRKGPGKLGTQPGQVKAIAASMRQGGFDPGKAITVMKEGDSYVVLAGHHRLEAAGGSWTTGPPISTASTR